MQLGYIVSSTEELDAVLPRLVPGAHVIFMGNLTSAVTGRRCGLVLRDTCVILTPEGRTLVAYLLRKPLEGTLANNLIKHGAGALNIPLCRVTADASAWTPIAQTGRFPSNVLLVHRECCQIVGTHRVHSGKTPEVLGERVSGLYNIGTDRKLASAWMSKCYGDDDGLETLALWKCAHGCPAAVIDGEDGGARYHPQFKSLSSALAWLHTLVGDIP
jgi:hypothetical protein